MFIQNLQYKLHKLNTAQIITLSFAGVIFVGGLILWLPFCTAAGQTTSFSDAMFTATTCVCVTGLVTVTTATHWSLIGKLVILLLIQIGGIGLIALASVIFISLNKKISLKNRRMIQESYNLEQMSGLVTVVRKVVLCVFAAEGIGAVGYAFCFVPEFGLVKGLGQAVFTAVSAFCNAGIDLVGESSFAPFVTNPLMNVTTMGLIILSGLGFPVWWEVIEHVQDLLRGKRTRKNFIRGFTLHTKLVLTTTVILITGGALLILLLDWNHAGSLGDLKPGEKVMAAFFQSITTRTAGFETIPQKNFTDGSAMVSMILMFIGGSPMGTAGGVKTITVALLIVLVTSYIRGNHDTVVWGRKVVEENIRSAVVIFFFALTTALTATILLVAVSGHPLLDCAYEIVSAVATVGLTRSLTSQLPAAGKIIVILIMYMGRIGPITLAVALGRRTRHVDADIQRPEQRILIG